MNELKIFSNEDFGELRTLELNGEPWFVAVDVCRALEIANPTDAIKRLDEDEKARFNLGLSGGDTNCVNEPGLYALVLGSRKPEARAFKRWIVHHVVPSIRRHGLYATPEAIKKILTDPKTLIIMLQTLDAEREQREALETQIEQDKRFTNFGKAMDVSSDAMLIGDFAKLVCNSGIKIGRTRLFCWLRDRGYLMKDNMPYQRYVDRGLFAVKEYLVATPKGSMIKTTTLITGKGQTVLLEELKKIPDWEKARDL